MSIAVLTIFMLILAVSVQQAPAAPILTFAALTKGETAELAAMSNPDALYDLTDRLAIPRVSGTTGAAATRNLIVSLLQPLGMSIEFDQFTSDTPKGSREFVNIIATYNPQNKPLLMLSAHYDSKWFPPGQLFIAATDSAAPCALLIDLARTVMPMLRGRADALNLGFQLVFFDGEEAFETWTATDSLYGSRHLAERWASDASTIGRTSRLRDVELMLLLDILGHANPAVYNFFRETKPEFMRLFSIEKRLRQRKLTLTRTKSGSQVFRTTQSPYYGVTDDHEPFLRRGVKVVHVVSTPFPEQWHKLGDDMNLIDRRMLADLASVFRIFVAEAMHVVPSDAEVVDAFASQASS